MDEILNCPTCHIAVRETDYFCFNCGKNLKPKPPSLSLVRLILIGAGSILFPPMGLFWGWPYLKQQTGTYKLIGLILIGITLASFIISTWWAVDFANKINLQVNEEMNRLQGF